MFLDKKPSNPCQGGCALNQGTMIKHTCPFRSEIDDDKETLCNCCFSCRNHCADEI